VARATLREIADRGLTPVVVGGTGFYLRALLEGLSPAPERDPALRERFVARERRRPGSLHRILARLDHKAAGRIHARDKNKTMRALEVCLLQRRPLTELFEKGRDPLTGFRVRKLGLDPPRALLYSRLNRRAAGMFEQGLLDEVRGLVAAGVPRSAKPFESLGYRQALDAIEGRLTVEQAVESTQIETRQYSKRQRTWFRREPDVHWLAGFGDDPSIQDAALAVLAAARD
jgi:tRNA dimethylallyltransferase